MIKTIQTGVIAREYDGLTLTQTEVKFGKLLRYSRLDLHMSYKLPKVKGLDMTLNGHIFNVLDEVFVQDAVDNSRYNSWGSKEHLFSTVEKYSWEHQDNKHWFDNQLLIIRGW